MKTPNYATFTSTSPIIDVVQSNTQIVENGIKQKGVPPFKISVFIESGDAFERHGHIKPSIKSKDIRKTFRNYIEQHPDLYANSFTGTVLLRCCKTNALRGFLQAANGGFVITAFSMSLLEELSAFMEPFTATTPIIVNRLIGFGNRGIDFDRLTFDTLTSPLGQDIFYPSIKEGVVEYVKRFYESSASVLLIYGPPGTGKSSLIRNFFKEDLEIRLVDNPNLIAHSDFGKMFTSGAAASSVKPRLTIFEDADSYLGLRSDGNHFLAPLLNITEGVVKTRDKFIISTNLTSTSKIDPALLRHGRCFDVLHLEPLEAERANQVRNFLNMDAVVFKEDKVTLSQALHYDQIKEKDHTTRQAMGF